jgi:hypothetical protein
MRTKQAEFLIREHVPVSCISEIITYNDTSANAVKEVLNKLNLEITVAVNPNNRYYY